MVIRAWLSTSIVKWTFKKISSAFDNQRLAAAQEAVAQQRSGRDCSPAPGHGMSPHPHQPPPGAKGPTSLFILSEDNPIRRYTRFIIEWPYPLTQTSTRNKLCNVFDKNQAL
ncbi:uncharacterized protein LOC126298060 [Schistocerca gregaria]|uniref:uncharacterized protein LOC126298060 n=1 Tax=Schistocerca gregaria TaxID=7010 RepID=UPI00211DE7EF|nr:uncharacterized protein LOC126298060 [Schistocerca gregaria]